MEYKCDYCDFKEKPKSYNLSGHVKRHHHDLANDHYCLHCGKFFSRKVVLLTHENVCNKNPNKIKAISLKKKQTKQLIEHKVAIKLLPLIKQIETKEQLFSKMFPDIIIYNDELIQLTKENDDYDIADTAHCFKETMMKNIDLFVKRFNSVLHNANKFCFLMTCYCDGFKFNKNSNYNDNYDSIDIVLIADAKTVISYLNIKDLITLSIDDCQTILEDTFQKDSGIIFNEIQKIEFNITVFSRNSRSEIENKFDENNVCYSASSYIIRPECLNRKKFLLNIENKDNFCLIWSCIAHFVKPKTESGNKITHPERVSLYSPYFDLFDQGHVQVNSMSELQIQRIERLNNIAITIFQLCDNIEFLDEKAKRKTKIDYTDSMSLSQENDENLDEEDENFEEKEIEIDPDGDEILPENTKLKKDQWDDNLFLPYRCSKYEPDYTDTERFYFENSENKNNRHVYLLLLRFKELSHFLLITDINKFFGQYLVCPNCLTFKCLKRSKPKYDQHYELCIQNKSVKVKMVDEAKKQIMFREFGISHPVPAYSILDFETTAEEYIDLSDMKSTKKLKKFTANSYGLAVKYFDEKLNYYCTDASNNEDELLEGLVNKLREIGDQIFNLVTKNADDKFQWDENDENTPIYKIEYENSKKCRYCYLEYNEEDKKLKKVIHHDHLTKKYIATCCQGCNAALKNKRMFYVLAHNLRGFDCNLIIDKIALMGYKIKLIPLTTQKYLNFDMKWKQKTGKLIKKRRKNPETKEYEDIFTLDENGKKIYQYEEQSLMMTIRFLDSMSFNPTSVEKWVKTLKKETSSKYKLDEDMKKTFHYTFSYFKNNYNLDDEIIYLLLQKGIYPYSYITSYDVLENTKQLPEQKEFEQTLTTKIIKSGDILEQIKEIIKWKVFFPYYNRVNMWIGIEPKNKILLFKHYLNKFEDEYLIKFPELILENNNLLIEAMLDAYDETPHPDNQYGEECEKLIEEDYFKFFEKQITKYYNSFEEISIVLDDIEYIHAKFVWRQCNCKNLMHYHMIYLRLDVLLTMDCFEDYRQFWLKTFEIEPLTKYGLPGVSWACMLKTLYELKMKNPENHGLVKYPELLTDPNMRLLYEKMRKGGICMSINKKVEIDPSKLNEALLYFDANNLYGGAMLEKLPLNGFMWLNEGEVNYWNQRLNTNECKIKTYNPNYKFGYTLEVDVHLPDHLHDYFADYPLFAENLPVNEKELSPWQQSFGLTTKVCKLMCTLNPKTKYIVDIRYLQFAISVGYVVTKIHNIITFEQEAWIKPYIEIHNDFSDRAKNENVKKLHKDAKNIIYGKCCQKQENQFEYVLTTNPYEAQRIINSPRYKGQRVRYSEKLYGFKLNHLEYTFNKPVQTAATILDISKLIMARAYYYNMKPFFDIPTCPIENQKIRILYTDTDSLVLWIRMNDGCEVYKDFVLANKEIFDLSSYTGDHMIFSAIEDDNEKAKLMKYNAKVVGKFKDELGDKKMYIFLSLRAKSYVFKYISKEQVIDESSKCKGSIKAPLFEDFDNCLINNKIIDKEQKSIRSDNHKLFIYNTKKRVLIHYDDKRYIESETSTETLPFGHKKIRIT